jgi:cytochrome c peroxidase
MKNMTTALAASALFVASTTFAQETDPAQIAIGERLFLETRFAQFFAANSGGDANAALAAGDPVLDTTLTTGAAQPGPFAGQSMNCRACHLVDEHNAALGNRTYGDFARRSPIPDRGDGRTTTARNSPPLVNASLRRPGGVLLHFDGEFSSGRALAAGTLVGRNFGWLPTERQQAIAHIAHIIRDDDGSGELARQFGGAYRDIFRGARTVPGEFRLSAGFALNVATATDSQILTAVARLIAAYMNSLTFSRNTLGQFNGSPYDVFLAKNKLPRAPLPDETSVNYAHRLFAQIRTLATIKWVTTADRAFAIHTDQDFVFGPTELAGMKIFFTGPGANPPSPLILAIAGAGNCIACHAPPTFTDFSFHNTGATQEEYDGIHGDGAFAALAIPTLAERRANPDASLPPSPAHPNATGAFASVPDAVHPGRTDLGLWNIFANPDRPQPQASLLRALTGGLPATFGALLPRTIGRFKTPGLRDLADSAPYLHNGSKDTLEDVLDFYRTFGAKARANEVRNAASQLHGIVLAPENLPPLAAFLRALNEDYE